MDDTRNGTERHDGSGTYNEVAPFETAHAAVWPKDATERALVEQGRVRDKLAAAVGGSADIASEMLADAIPQRPRPLRTSPYDDARQEATEDQQLAAEYNVSADALAHDENAGLRLVLHNYRRGTPVIAWLESQLIHERKRAHAAEAERVKVEGELGAARGECARLKREIDAQREAPEAADSAMHDIRALAFERGVELGRLRTELDAVHRERDDLRRELAEAVSKRDEFQNECWRLYAVEKALTEERDTLAAKLDAANGALADVELDNARLEDERDAAAATLAQAEAALVADATDDWRGKFVALEGQYKREVARLRAELNYWRAGSDLPTFDDLVAIAGKPYTRPEPKSFLERRAAHKAARAIALDCPLPDENAPDECDSPAAVRMDSETERKARTPKFEPPTRSKPDDLPLAG